LGIRGGQVKSVKSLRNSMKKGGGGQGLTRVPADDPMTVRFLHEPDTWFEFFEHFDETKKRFFVCVDGCEYCADDQRPSKRVLASVVLTDEGKVVPLAMPAMLVNRMLNKYDKYATVMDRDYELVRTGQGFDTEYDVTPEAPNKMKLSRFELLDPVEILESMAPDSDDDDDDDEDEAPRSKSKSRPAPKRRPVDEDEDEDDDEDDEDEDEEFLRPKRSGAVKPKAKPRATGGPSATPRAKPKARKLSK
jgi:hypothetical protein